MHIELLGIDLQNNAEAGNVNNNLHRFFHISKHEAIAMVVMLLCLIAFVLVTFANFRVKAREATCASSLKQLCVGFSLYSQDYDNKMPPDDKWSDAVNPYVDYQHDVFYCPEAKSNDCAFSMLLGLDGVSIKSIKSPRTSVMLFEADGGWNSSLPLSAAVARHRDGFNCGYIDGHVELVKIK